MAKLKRDVDFTLLASSPTIEGIIKHIGNYWYSKNISLHEVNGKTVVHNALGQVKGYEVVGWKKGGFAFIRLIGAR